MTKKIILYILVFSINTVCIPLLAQDVVAVTTPEGIEISEGSAKVLFYQIGTKCFRLPEDIAFVNAHGKVVPTLLAVDAGPWLDFSGRTSISFVARIRRIEPIHRRFVRSRSGVHPFLFS